MSFLVKSALSDRKHQQLIEHARPALLPDETIIDVTSGMIEVHRFGGDQARRGTLVVTNQRVFFFTKRLGGFDVQDFAFGLLSGCNFSTGSGFSTIELIAPGDKAIVKQVLKDEAKRIGPLIRTRMAASQNVVPVVAQPDVAEQLQKIDKLRAGGLLQEHEYQAKRAEIIARL